MNSSGSACGLPAKRWPASPARAAEVRAQVAGPASLSYLTKLSANGTELAEIPPSTHWAMYSNPAAMWERIAEFHSRGKPD